MWNQTKVDTFVVNNNNGGSVGSWCKLYARRFAMEKFLIEPANFAEFNKTY